ncbi:type II toxin-antitoxin system RelE/ParE family toxin [Candidatus Parcubacteria bacterium]|nr:type II toxin-antitoxin system RelE/ParE family toxin [Candidatus Parcubacteria bacterium]
MPTKLLTYKDKNGREPFEEWLNSLNNQKTQSIILNRLNRVSLGNFGDCRNLGQGIYKLRIHYSSGFRVYFGMIERVVIVLLSVGAKKSQKQDIAKAKKYWQNFKNNNLK